MEHKSEYNCSICDKTFDEFVIFEGHFTFNVKCLALGPFMQCYICAEKFYHYAVLKYHLQSHKNVIQKINLINENQDKVSQPRGHSEADATISNRINGSSKENFQHKTVDQIDKTKSSDELQRMRVRKCYRCHVCTANCYNKAQLDRHLKVHKYGTVKCETCNIVFTKISLVGHMKRFHQIQNRSSASSYQCKFCNKLFASHLTMMKHLNVHSSGKLKCDICEITFTQYSLTLHNRQTHPELFPVTATSQRIKRKIPHVHFRRNLPNNNNGAKYCCEICNARFTHHLAMKKHLKVHSVGTFKCDICNIRFTQNSLTRHKRLNHPELLPTTTTPQQIKKVTTTPIFPSAYHSLRHPMVISSSKKSKRGLHQCDICKAFNQNMKRHMELYKIGKFKYIIRRTQFNSGNILERHKLQAHSNLQNDEPANGILDQNKNKMLAQDGEENDNTKKVRHDGNTSYQCKICKVFCCNEEHLEQHEKRHSGAYKCEICNISFTKQTLWRHLKQAHPTFKKQKILKFPCRVCKVNCPTQEQLEEHMKNHKEDEFTHEERSNTDQPRKGDISNTPAEILVDERSDSLQPPNSSNITKEQDESTEKAVDEYYEVEEIISHKKYHDKMIYLVRWVGFGPEDNTWEASSAFEQCPDILNSYRDKKIHNLENHAEARTWECYICKKHFLSSNALSVHENKHTLYQQWVDPSSVTLSNCSPENLREILQNQPLVLVENLDMNSIHFGPQNKNCIVELSDSDESQQLNDLSHLELQTNTEGIEQHDPECNIEQDTTINDDDIISVIDIDTEEYEDNVHINSNSRISNEEREHYLMEADSSMQETVPVDRELVEGDCNQTIELSDNEECEEQPTVPLDVPVDVPVDVPLDATLDVPLDVPLDKDVIDISSDSDDDVEIINDAVFYCYFCENKFYSLKNLGTHIKMCSPID